MAVDITRAYRGAHESRDLDQHPLAHATYPTPSADGATLYVVCACGRRRVVSRADWGMEKARREAEASRKETDV
jgi:hypothetical protein